MRNKEILQFVTTWMDLEYIYLSQKKANILCYHFSVESKKAELKKKESRMLVTRVWAVEELGRCWFTAAVNQNADTGNPVCAYRVAQDRSDQSSH